MPHQRRHPSALLVCAVALLACAPVGAQEYASEEHRFRVVTLAEGLSHPWGIAFLPGGDLLVTERAGRVRLISGAQARDVPGAPQVWANGQGGLLDIERHPRFAETRFVYLTYSKPSPEGATTALARARFDGDRLIDLRDLFVGDARTRMGQHFGSRIVFDSAGMVYIGIGDRGIMQQAQNPTNHQGTIIRLHDDGRVPDDNPFVDRSGWHNEIFAYGVRNPQGMALHPQTGELWENEHGPRGGDEINVIRRGANYGWPAITFGIDYSGAIISEDTARAGMEQPVLYWVPSIAVSGMTFYTGDRFPRWRGNVFVGALAGQHLRRIVFDGRRPVHQEVLLEGRARIRQVKTGPDGLLYVLTDENNGKVLRLEPVP